jgi:hypothetical protein
VVAHRVAALLRVAALRREAVDRRVAADIHLQEAEAAARSRCRVAGEAAPSRTTK